MLILIHHTLSNILGKIDVKTINDSEGLTGLLRKPPSMQRDLQPLSHEQISGFKLQPGKLGDLKSTLSSSHRKKKKRKDQEDGEGLSGFVFHSLCLILQNADRVKHLIEFL